MQLVNATYRPSALTAGSPVVCCELWFMGSSAGQDVVLSSRSRTKTPSQVPSPGTKLSLALKNTHRPSAVIAGDDEVVTSSPPADVTDARNVVPACRSRTKTSCRSLKSSRTRLFMEERKATTLPSSESTASLTPQQAVLSPWVPAVEIDTRSVVPLMRSRTKRSASPFVSPETRVVAFDTKATNLPSPEMTASLLLDVGWPSSESSDARMVMPRRRSRTKTSVVPFVSVDTRLVADDCKGDESSVAADGRQLRLVVAVASGKAPRNQLERAERPNRQIKTSESISPSRSAALEWNATNRPSPEMDGPRLLAEGVVPPSRVTTCGEHACRAAGAPAEPQKMRKAAPAPAAQGRRRDGGAVFIRKTPGREEAEYTPRPP